MSTLTFTTQTFRGSPLGGDSPLPTLTPHRNLQSDVKCDLPEGDTLFAGYGRVRTVYPYTQQDRYNRELVDMDVDVAVLENNMLKATFLPGYGGRLWSLWDKRANRDLLYVNDVLRPSNLALRNAWFSGGVEWNCGVIGHHAFTCDQMFTASFDIEGVPVLRFYQWDRIRNCTYCIDFYLPDGSAFLFNRVRIHNPNPETVPMYWWSNTAVPEAKGGRIAVPACESYLHADGAVVRGPAPINENGDFSYPMNTPVAKDYFYYLPDERRKFEGYILPDGMGLIQTSTSELKGRKLFIWGQQPGGETWQKFLTENAGPYVEVQAGIGRTQFGCVPMQPYGTWEFAEAYGLMTISKDQQSGEYTAFVSAVESSLDAALPAQKLEDWLAATADSMGRANVPARAWGKGDAALENELRLKTGKRPLSANLDFGKTGPEHADFEHLLAYGYMPSRGRDYVPGAFVGPQWKPLLEAAVGGADRDNWLTWYHLGLVTMADEIHDYMTKNTSASGSIPTPGALDALQRAAGLCANGPVLYALAVALDAAGQCAEAAACAVKCCRLFGGDLSVAKDTLRLLLKMGTYEPMLVLYDGLPAGIQTDGRVEYLKVSALVHLGRCEEALAILERPGYSMADFREGEQSVNALWAEIVRRTGRTDLILPAHLNFNAGG